jgi:hypothetical protein
MSELIDQDEIHRLRLESSVLNEVGLLLGARPGSDRILSVPQAAREIVGRMQKAEAALAQPPSDGLVANGRKLLDMLHDPEDGDFDVALIERVAKLAISQDESLRRLEQQLAAQARIPREPTLAMIDAGKTAMPRAWAADEVWRAMYDAAQSHEPHLGDST